MGWENLVLSAVGILAGGGVTAVILNHELADRRGAREDAVRLYAEPLEKLAHAGGSAFREAQKDRLPRLDLHSFVSEEFDRRLQEIPGLERLSSLPEGFDRLPLLYRRLLKAYADCRLAIRDRLRRGEDASAEEVKRQELEDLFAEVGRSVATAYSRIRCLRAWSYDRMLERVRRDEELVSCGQRLLDLEESLEALQGAVPGENHPPGDEGGLSATGGGVTETAKRPGAPGEPESHLAELIADHENLRRVGINLVASENRLPPAALRALGSDLAGRYHAEGYGGSIHARRITKEVERLARETFGADHALVTPLSGNMCVLAVLFAFTSPGESVGLIPFQSGGYPFGVEKFHRRPAWIPVHPDTLEINPAEAVEILVREKARVAFLGASFIPFPHPVAEIRRGLLEAGHECLLAYDGSHVLGLVACGEFQDPLREGADILMGSTHKSLFGPQGGIIITNRGELAKRLRKFLELDLEAGIGLVDNPHLNRIAALGIALEELQVDPTYGRRVVENARALAEALHADGVPVRFAGRGFTASHQVLLDLGEKEAERMCRDLERHGIFIDAWGRLGTAEVTRQGMGTGEMRRIAGWIAAVYHGDPPPGLASEVKRMAERFSSPAF
ncbi:hypothetical protein [Candidatus Solincola sp.]|jgi:glycine hydroxymethyltransferase